MSIAENIREALAAVRTNKLRAGLTILIIGFGITSIVGVLTSIDAIKYWMMSSFTTLGANTFRIQERTGTLRIGGSRDQVNYPVITLRQARDFTRRMEGTATVSIEVYGPFGARARYEHRTTNNNLQVRGTDEHFLQVNTYDIAQGRNLTKTDVEQGRPVCVVGHELLAKLFPDGNAVGKHLYVNHKQLEIVGVFKEKGTSFGSAGDKIVVAPYTTVVAAYKVPLSQSYQLNVFDPNAHTLPLTAQVAQGLFRLSRGLKPKDPDNFGIAMSDSFVNSLMENLRILTWSATAIAIITLGGASIGLMNIMLVSVTERTMEIGLRKALGATRRQVLMQFLVEAVTITQLGGLAGIVLGLGIGNLISHFFGVGFIIPWAWIVLAIGICFVVGLSSGLYPARKAASLDPIDSLRYE